MNTKTMRLPPRRVLTHTTSGASSKRKEGDNIDPTKTKSLKPTEQAVEPDYSNQLLAGYLAHEYLTKGTLFGEPRDPTQPQSPPVKSKPIQRLEAEPDDAKHQRYVEVANLLKENGVHLPGILNPTHLARFLQM
ncbi:hypothetical protein CFOL_v3_29727 [Cephalotus follicularis]|uniref:Uncharacterized protein n=1 Tax=Cephalotus follicularis TaxID=3775 RepID=A0A1Q3D1H2_CEPFO|nr:hypothetical protein CFOL_v3_29727 [Cephalotus follicularis]